MEKENLLASSQQECLVMIRAETSDYIHSIKLITSLGDHMPGRSLRGFQGNLIPWQIKFNQITSQ
jgi:hypothetical protein